MKTGREESKEDVTTIVYKTVIAFIDKQTEKTNEALHIVNNQKLDPKIDKEVYTEREKSLNNYLTRLEKIYDVLISKFRNDELTYQKLFEELDNLLADVAPKRGIFSNPWQKQVGNQFNRADIEKLIGELLKGRANELSERESASLSSKNK